MKTAKVLPVVLLGLMSAGCVVTPVGEVAPMGQVTADTAYGDTRVRLEVSNYPDLAVVPGTPVYYAPGVNENYFFYDGMYWVFQGDNWYASYWFNGPWSFVRIDLVPVYILRVPVYYYRRPPPYFQPWRRTDPPHWGERWGHDWEERHPGWMRTEGAVPPPAPRPDYQRNYGGRRYPSPDEQSRLRERYYPYQPRERIEGLRNGNRAPETWQQQQEQWQQRRQEQQDQDRRQRTDQPPGRDDRGMPAGQWRDDRGQPAGQGRDDRGMPPGQRGDDRGMPPGQQRDDRAPGRDDRPQWRYDQGSPAGEQGNVPPQDQYDRWRQRQQDMDPRFQQGQGQSQGQSQNQTQGQQRQWRGEWRQQPAAPDIRDQGNPPPRGNDNAPAGGWSTYRQEVPANTRPYQYQLRQDSDGGWSSQAPEPRTPRTHVRGAPGSDNAPAAPQWRRIEAPAPVPQGSPDGGRAPVRVQQEGGQMQPQSSPQAGGAAPRGRRGEPDRRRAPQGQSDGQSGSQGGQQGSPGNPGGPAGTRDGGR